jgi:hypothetical protein
LLRKTCHEAFARGSIGRLLKLIAIALLAVFGLPFASPLFALAPKSEANLPACCRRNGTHHCMMSMAERSAAQSNSGPRFAAPQEKCPYCPAAFTFRHLPNKLGVPSAQFVFACFASHAAVIAQTESKRRIARDRSRQKRGPPSFSLL